MSSPQQPRVMTLEEFLEYTKNDPPNLWEARPLPLESGAQAAADSASEPSQPPPQPKRRGLKRRETVDELSLGETWAE